MKNLGKHLIILLMALAPLSASVDAFIDKKKVVLGETVTYTVLAAGDDVQRPKVDTLCGEEITSSSQSTSIRGVNGKFTREYSFSYVFMPKQDCTVGPVTIKINGKEESTKAIDISVVPMKVTKDTPFIIEMSSDKKSVYVGEPFAVTIDFKQHHNSRAVDAEFSMPEMKNFWNKAETKEQGFEEGKYTVTRLTYVMAAQHSGIQSISPVQIKVATRAPARNSWGQFFSSLQWQTYFSNGIDLDVKPLPQGVELVGNFAISAAVDKTELDANEAVNVTLQISGSGNFEDIPSQKPAISGVTVFDEEGTTKAYIEQGNYRGGWTQKLAFVSDSSYTIPPFTLRYFDTVSETLKTIQTEAIHVKVKSGAPEKSAGEEPLTIKRSKEQDSAAPAQASAAAGPWGVPFGMGMLLGLVVGMAAMMLPWKRWFSKEGDSKRVDFKDQKAVLMMLLQHCDDPEIAQMVRSLEANLYEGANEVIDKKVLKNMVMRVREK